MLVLLFVLYLRYMPFLCRLAQFIVFAYPAGSEKPVQLRAGDDSNVSGDFGYTEPVDPENMPARQIKRPGGFARFFNMISGGRWFKEVTAYDIPTAEALKNIDL